MKPTRIIRGADPYGCPIVRVEIARHPGVFATVDADDFEAWTAEGLPTRWYMNADGPRSTIRVIFANPRVKGGMAGVARELLQPGHNRRVRYIDGDRLNLRRSNLTTEVGKAGGQSPVPASHVPLGAAA